ncbi:MAG: tetratricopeptide repeat protein, partial [Porticoccaceae bacterium]|nr:tetratricopeptide repeat protein [Porticoccaceae bacterium]
KSELDAAIDSHKQAIKIKPDYVEAYYNMGVALNEKIELDAAIDSYKQAIKIKPDYAEAYGNMGIALKDKGEVDAAIDSYKQALKIKPDYADAYSNMGVALKGKGDLDAAIESYKQAIKIKPDYADAYSNMGIALKNKGELDAAIDSHKQAIKIEPDYAGAYNNMGVALYEKGELDAAIDSYKQAIKIKSDYADAYYNMGVALKEKGDLEAAIDSYKQALKIKPDYEIARVEKLHQQAQICDWAAIEEDRDLLPLLGTVSQCISPFSFMQLEDAPERHRLRSELYAKEKYPQKPLSLAIKPSQKPKRLRIGYFSSDFRQHSVAHGIVNILASHDRDRFEIYGYSFGPDDGSELRQKLIKAVDVFDDVKEMKDRDIALLARQDEIDIAIDLNGYTNKNRAGIFAYRAAPIQAHFWGSASSMGTDSIDYYIGDYMRIPKEYEHGYSESIIRLPYWTQAKYDKDAVSDLPMTRADMGLPGEGFVFCCFNNSYKISSAEFDIWMRLLNKVSGSVLWILKSNKSMEQNLQQEAKKRGVAAERLVFAERVPHPVHLARQRLADLLLDTFNVNAGVTAGDALWVGLPMITKIGKGHNTRICGSLLKAIDMPELITETEREYEALILDLATNPERLSSIKRKLADNRLSKPLFNTDLFTKHLEAGYQQAYQRYFDGKNPANIYVNEQPKPLP